MSSPRVVDIALPYNWTPRRYQHRFWRAMERGAKRAVLCWHRRCGKDLASLNWMICASQERKGLYWHMLPSYAQGRKAIWDGQTNDGRRFIDHVPKELIARVRDDEMKIWLRNGSIIQLIGADEPNRLVGSNPVGMNFSEYSVTSNYETCWELMSPILAANDGWAVWQFTPRGRNHAWRLFQRAQNLSKTSDRWFCERLTIDDTTDETGAPLVGAAILQEERDAGKSEEYIRQEYYCFPAGTLIHTSRGQVPIEQIQSGDLVLSHAGRWRKVTKTLERPYDGSMVEIESYGEVSRPLRCTPNHPVRVYEPSTQTYRWIEAGDVKVGHLLVMPRLKVGQPLVPEHLAILIGWYLAEGSVGKNSVQFSLHIDERDFADEIVRCAELFGAKAAQVELTETSARMVSINSTRLADFLVEHCGSGAKEKRIPFNLISGHERAVFDRLMLGDGCEANARGYRHWAYATVSHNLARDVQLLSSTLGFRAGISSKGPHTSVIRGRQIRGGPSHLVQIREVESNQGSRLRPGKHGVGAMVRSVREIPGPDRVYNFSVQYDESYVAEGRVVHNCDFDIALVGAFYGTHMAKARAEGRITKAPWEPSIPVDTGWDLGSTNATCIWFKQQIGHERRIIDFYRKSGEDLSHFAKVLSEKPYTYGKHYGPHDIEVKELSAKHSRKEILRSLGVKITTVPRIEKVSDGIETVRNYLNSCWFDETKCAEGIQGLLEYVKKETGQKDANGQLFYSEDPVHNWASDVADSFRTLACGDKIGRYAKQPSESKRVGPSPYARRVAIV